MKASSTIGLLWTFFVNDMMEAEIIATVWFLKQFWRGEASYKI